MNSKKTIKIVFFLTLSSFFLSACNGKLPGGDARKNPADPAKRVEKILLKDEVLSLMKHSKKKVAYLILQTLMNFGEHL